MRILIATLTRRIVGGAERYVESAIAAFTAAGHRVALLAECEGPTDRPLLGSGGIDASWVMEQQSGQDEAARWRPDIVFSHGLSDPVHEAGLLRIAPVVLTAHDYRGQCISGSKTLARRHSACTRTLSARCLFHYFPDGCGGRSPLTMMTSWSRARAHRDLFGEYAAIVTLSEHMRRACIAHGARPQTTIAIPPAGPRRGAHADAEVVEGPDLGTAWRLLFVGRLERLKGGDLLIDAGARLARERRHRITITFVGEGTMRGEWEARGRAAGEDGDTLAVSFAGWREPHELRHIFGSSHLLVVPSVWPEPYGLVGTEAARLGVPAVAFPLGGIPEWLIDGVTGRLAALPPTAASLGDAIADVLGRPEAYARLRRHAAAAWARDARPHFDRVIALLEDVCKWRCAS
jgi:glycosyltransferase involved in cell wall biosynthesis